MYLVYPKNPPREPKVIQILTHVLFTIAALDHTWSMAILTNLLYLLYCETYIITACITIMIVRVCVYTECTLTAINFEYGFSH